MKTNANFKKKTKNSFIYFQVGLIVTMLTVLFILEFQFKDVVKKVAMVEKPLVTDEPFSFTLPVVKPKVAVVEKVKPLVKVNKVIEKVKIEKNDIEIKKTDLPKENIIEKITSEGNTVETATINSNVLNEGEKSKKNAPTVFSVEQLPMFKACKGLNREEQKACFDEQLAKAVSRYLEYPEADYENGNQGTALVEFVIDKQGNITNVTAIDNNRATDEMKKAAEKAVKRIPRLIPAKQGKENVSIKYSLPILFKLQ